MTIDIHTHLMGADPDSQKILLMKAVERYQISKIFVSGLNLNPNPTEEMIRVYNDKVAEFKSEHPEHVEGYSYISPELPSALYELQRGIEDQGMIGVKIWMSTLCDDPCINPIAEKMIDYGIPILIHSFYKAINQLPNETLGGHVANLARRYPELKIIMAHFGGCAYHGIPAIRDCKNVWVDNSGSIFRGDDMAYAIEMLGVDRILFGSDMPGNYIVNLGQVLELPLSEEAKDKILYKNALKVFDRNFRLVGGRV